MVAVTIPEEKEVDLKPCIRSRVVLSGLRDDMWTEEHAATLDLFLKDVSKQLLVVYIDEFAGLKVEQTMPHQEQKQLTYFIRHENAEITAENFQKTVQFGTVRRPYIDSLVRILNSVFLPRLFHNTNWPESIKNEFFSEIYHFMTSLTDTRSKMKGRTVLYIPIEALSMKPEVVVKDKALVQRLETSMIHWTRQIKEVLRAQEAVESRESTGPLEEIEFWTNRCTDLSEISKQLCRQGVTHIESILLLSKSSYVAPFQRLARQIQDGSEQAQSNLRFLSILKEPFQELSTLRPKDIPDKLPRLISLVRIIWVNSPYYNTRERITALFRKMSNKIILMCCQDISLDRIFEGYVVSSRQSLHDCISCMNAWKDCYLYAAQMHNRLSGKGWVLDQTSIFAQVDAFVQRCKDLLEVCDCQQHFARWEDGKQTPLPCFFGHRGPQMTRNLLEIEETFQKHLHTLRNMKGGILDVKNTFWHEDFNRFRSGVKDLEVMTQNLITSAFETVRDVEHGVEIQDIFHHLSAREAIKRTFDKKAVDVYMLFNRELSLVNKELSKKLPFLPPHMCHYSGLAHWLRALRRRIDRPLKCLSNAHFLPHIGTGEESFQAYQLLVQAMDEIERKTFQEWAQTLDKDSLKRLDTPLLIPSAEKSGMLDINFDKDLLKLFVEIHYWERLLFEIPHYVVEVYDRKEDLRNLRENLLLVARDYNRIIAMLSPEERALFKERIRYLDKKIQPGLKKLHWSLKGASAAFISECRLHASKVQTIVNEYKAATLTVARSAQQISEALLVRITGKRVYNDLEFEEDQKEHRAWVQQKLMGIHEEVINIMRQTYEVFKHDSAEVQQYWMAYTVKMNRMMEEAFRLNVKWSLLELSKAINGDGKTTPNPLFRVKVILQDNYPAPSAQVEFSPTLAQLANMVNDISSHLIASISVFRHLPEILTKRKFHRDPISVLVERDEDIKKIQALVSGGMQANATHLQAYLKTWDVYREIWEVNKDSFINRYRHLNPLVSSFDADTARYMEVANNVQKEETVLNIQFVMLDCSHLKFSVVQHCNEWQNKLTNLLNEMASTQLQELYAYLQENAKKVSRPPQTLEELGQSLQLLDTLQHELPKLEGQIPPIHEQFAILEKYEVTVDEGVLQTLGALNSEWLSFQQCILESDVMLKKHKEKFKTGLIHSADDFKKKAQVLLQDFGTKGPFTCAVSCETALEQIAVMRQLLATMKDEESTLRSNLGIFKIEQPASKDLQKLEKELDYLQQVWEITKEWEDHWNEWKTGSFKTLQTEVMETTAYGLFRKLNKLSRELKDRNWEIIETSKAKVEQFKRTMPLISDLRNPALRERHWDQVKDLVLRTFDQDAEDFRLENIVELGLDQHVEKISEISASASKELSIELALQAIAKTWDVVLLDIVPYKDKGHHRLRGTDEVFQALEDNQVSLSTMKASRFVKPFEKEVDRWERCLSLILEVIEMVLTVQRQWMYLENIFLGEDIRKQLPQESASFDQINASWKTIMDRLNKDNNALRGTHFPGLLDKLVEMNSALEEIQKSLDMYLETKRHIFPRFYFLSNDDLLEILGQSRNPEAVQPHLKKCFDNIKSLKIQKVGMGNKSEAVGMYSLDGEYVEFAHSVLLEGPVEEWLCDVERAMRLTLKELLRNCRLALKKMLTKRDKWVKEWAGQMVITASQIQWTTDVTKCLANCKERGDKKFLKVMKKKQVSLLNKYSEAIRGSLTKIMRLKIVALVTVEIHARDVIEKLYKSSLMDVTSFEWLSQLRLYWDKDLDDCVIRQTNTQFPYGYEYLGNSGRLVITPLTDRCYITLTTALHLHRGGSPKGPAGTGKTETVKDLGKALGMYVIVVNCSEGLDYKSMGRMYSGLAQTGAWGCFDEFNRINIEVLSVVAQQILSILSALAANMTSFIFEGHKIKLVWSCGIFITMNPGYAGRTELPDNLKSMFRPISMVVPDSTLIAEIILFGEGFSNCKLLAKKVYTLYSLAVQQLSKQDHYDFGLRALTSLLRYAGKKRRVHPDITDEEILLMAMKDMNIAKLASVDVPLFNGIVQDLFPGIESPVIDYGKLKEAIELELKGMGLQLIPFTITKVIQLYETKNSRHSTMIVGNTGSGKTVTWRTLQATMSALCRSGDAAYNLVREFPLNPKAVSLGELYGEYDLSTGEWTDGILSSVMRAACADEKPDEKWILFDGPVDTLWIESMNSVMDDNKVLTLINGERISMPEQVSLLFEVENLAVASPATVSRCGMVYTDYSDLGWKPYVHSWIEKRPKGETEALQRMFDKFIDKMLTFKKENCEELVPIPEYSGIVSLCKLFSALATPENGVNPADGENYTTVVEMYFIFSMIWSVCAAVDEEGRKKIDSYLREMEGSFPNKDTVYEYFVDPKRKNWASFEDKLPKMWRYPSNAPFYKIIVPTVDTVRYNYLVNALVSNQNPVLLVGPVGTGKTSIAQSVLQSLDNTKWAVLTVNMSAQTTSNNVQNIIESRVEKRTKGVYVPMGGKSMITFMDDLNMPAKDAFGSQPPLELLRLWIDYGFWYDREKQTIKYIKDMFLMAAMGPPGGGRTVISGRLQSRFNLINMTFPTETQIRRIFGTMLNQKLQNFEEAVKPLGNVTTEATVELYHAVVQKFLPTPAKIHYLFNLRDISKVFQGMLRAHKDFHDTKPSLTRLWIHECFRVFSDRLVDSADKDAFVALLSEKLGSFFDLTFHNLCPSKRPPIFGDFMREPRVYEDLVDLSALKLEMERALDEYNQTPGVVQMQLVLFRDAIEHITRIVRVIGQPRGNMLLVGIGGSGRQSLARLASSICEDQTFQIEVTKHYRKQEFRDDIKKLYRQAGVDLKPTTFLFVDTQIMDDSFLEDINNILSSGEVPNLYKADEFEEIQSVILDAARADGIPETADSLFGYLIERVRNNLHVVVCLSPIGDPFRNWIRQYPALVNCTTIDWFSEWPHQALLEVAEKYLEGVDLGGLPEVRAARGVCWGAGQGPREIGQGSRCSEWPLMIDPQCQASKWIKNMEAAKGLKIIDLQMGDYLRVLEGAVQFGSPVLLQNVQEELDPSLAPILNKSVTRIGGRLLLRLADKEVEYSPDFRFYLTTKLSNPHYTPETSSQTTIVNFAVKEQGLEAQLLGTVVRKERPELEEQKDSLVLNIAAGKSKLKELEDEILRLLNEATGSLLDDVQLVNTLQTSKVTASEVTEQLETSETTEIKIDTAREAYRPCAQRASILFFVLNDMGRIDPMYQFSLDAYIDLFNMSIHKSHRSTKLEERIRYLNEYHTYAVYRFTCRGLFERHKLLFSFQMCAKILETSGNLKMDEYNFFLRGGVVLDREGQMDNPCSSWLTDTYWDNVTELDKLTNFHGIMNSFEQYPRDWHLWYTSAKPEKALLPGEWENSCNQMQRMLVVRSLRPDRVAFCVTFFIVSNLGSQFIEPPVLNMKSVVEDSTPRTPLIFVLSPGVDPTSSLLQLAEQSGMAQRFHALSLGQGQAPIATRMIQEGVRDGNWVFLANCHLSLSWMPQLDKLVEQLQVEEPHPAFRLWLSSSPHPDFPISILQASIKMTTEPPTGLKANMKRLYQLVTEPQFGRCTKPAKYKKLLFALCFFHSVLLERKKFLQLGWNVVYGFNDSDFEVSENLLSLYLDEYEETPWDALKYLIAGVNYGGHVTDSWDRRLLTTYINDYFCEQSLAAPFYKLSVLDTYYIPKDGNLASYREFISMLPGMDLPEAFGQHPNADVASQITEARTLFETLLSLQPQITPSGAAGQSREDKVLELSADVLSKIPQELDYRGTQKVLADDPSPLNVVLLQEIQRYNALLQVIRSSLVELERGIQGLVVMSTTLEEIFNCIFDARVPPMWERAYPSLKPLAAWTRDLGQRVEQFARWAETAHPPVLFWLSGFTFPTGFLTAVLQAAARQNNCVRW
ncbi:dynein heavy chain 2, axonemal [Terrapene carolina triunguis]|uniref:dynein heavy chain 2, axonemal n=1 Tax=Terrapene triunguis TaxID=2587831 RepID=UPI0011560DF5|nr:dynein heavy chain 2, axonemal [Terrapene carolina triunguis]